MSTYATMQASLKYPDQESFNQVVNDLVIGGWLKDSYFLDEMENRINEGDIFDVDPVNLTIELPFFHYRNLCSFNFFVNENVKGYVIGTSTDGMFVGWVIEDGEEQNFDDLAVWAKENLEDDDKMPPVETDSDYAENLNEWQSMVESEFFADLCP